MNHSPRPLAGLQTPADFKAAALRHHMDVAGIARCADLDGLLPEGHRPRDIHAQMKSFLVLGKKMIRGAVWAKNLVQKHFAGGRTLKHMDEYLGELCDEIERQGRLAMVTSPLAIDYRRRGPHDLAPAGQGSLLVRTAAVLAGLGAWGLNMMVLTPRFGPRVFFSGVLLDVELAPDQPLAAELCLGLEACGRCAAICPEESIPRRARQGATLAEVRRLDAVACTRSSQPFGPAAFAAHLSAIFAAPDKQALWSELKSRMTGELWQELSMMKEGALTGCMECTQVCPVGEDYVLLSRSPHRREDLPEALERSVTDGMIEVKHYGPQFPRLKTVFPWDVPLKSAASRQPTPSR